jgi:hypothetical protein
VSAPKGTRAAVASRVYIVYKLLLLGADRQRILEHVGTKYPEWGARPRTVDSYTARARQLIIESGAYDWDMELGRSLARKHDLYTRFMNDHDYRGAMGVQDRIDDLLGLKAPIEINLTDARQQLVELMVQEVMREADNATAGAAEAD